MSTAVCFVGLGLAEWLVPSHIPGAQYRGTSRVPFYREVDILGQPLDYCDRHACAEVECPVQGPFSAIHSLVRHPLLLLNGVLALIYLIAEVLLIQHPLGVVLKVKLVL